MKIKSTLLFTFYSIKQLLDFERSEEHTDFLDCNYTIYYNLFIFIFITISFYSTQKVGSILINLTVFETHCQ